MRKRLTNNRNFSFAVILAITFILVSVVTFSFWYAKDLKHGYETRIRESFTNSYLVSERHVANIFQHTQFILKMMNLQIQDNPTDLKHVESILTRYKIDPKAPNAIPWTYFDWVDTNDQVVVNAVKGILPAKDRVSVAKRDYIPLVKKFPGKMQFNRPDYGSTSGRWLVPLAMGLTDKKGNYVGATNIGIELNTLANQIRTLQKDPNISFYLVDSKNRLLINSNMNMQTMNMAMTNEMMGHLLAYSQNATADTNLDFMSDESAFHVKYVQDSPFKIYLHYDTDQIKSEYAKRVLYRSSLLLLIGALAIGAVIKIYLIYTRETRLRIGMENSYELAKKSVRSKNEFLAYTGHELRSPLNGILFGSEMIMNKTFGPMHPKYLEYVRDIHQNGLDLLHFIEDLIDVSRVEEGNFRLVKEPVNIDESIRRVIHLNAARAAKSGIKIETFVQKGMPELNADPKRLRQILNNLISNSVKYSPDNTIIKILVHSIDDITQIIVEDQGFGMTREQLEVALSKYGTVDNDNTGKVESIGLGLPLVKSLVESHGAKFEIESEKDIGTKVTISFPIHRKATTQDDKKVIPLKPYKPGVK